MIENVRIFTDLAQILLTGFVLIRKYTEIFDHHTGGAVVHLLAGPPDALGSSPGHQTKGHHVALGWWGDQGWSPAPGGAPGACFCLFFLWL